MIGQMIGFGEERRREEREILFVKVSEKPGA